MKLIVKIKARISEYRFGKMFLEHYGFKTLVLALFSLIISVAFATFNGVIGVLEKSAWYGMLAAYYITLILFRSAVIVADKTCRKKIAEDDKFLNAQNKIYLASGAFLVITEVAMAAAVTQMIMHGNPVNRGEITAIATAAYAFTKTGLAVYNLFKAKKYADPVSRSLRCLNFADACMSMVSLTVVLLATFSGEQDSETEILFIKAGVGFAACAIVSALASYIIITAVKKLRKNTDE